MPMQIPSTGPSRSRKVRGGLLALACVSAIGAAVYFCRGYFWHPVSEMVSRPTDPISGRPERPVPHVPFHDVTDAAGIKFTHNNGAFGKKLLPETMGGGVCVFDYDGDGLQDVLFVGSCSWPGCPKQPNAGPSSLTLYRNMGDGTFKDVTDAAGLTITMYGIGACAGDIDNSGYPSLFVTGVGGCKLFRNVKGADGKRKFVDATAESHIGVQGAWPGQFAQDFFLKSSEPIEFASTATFLDYDGDGKLDLFVCHYAKWAPAIDLAFGGTLDGIARAYLPPTKFDGSQCVLYRNLGNGTFKDVTEEAGIKVYDGAFGAKDRPVAKSLGVTVVDVDGQGWPSLIVANDTVRNFFFHNVPDAKGGRRFEEMGLLANVAFADGKARGAMGIDWGEYSPGKHGAVIANFSNEPLTFLTRTNPKSMHFTNSSVVVQLEGPSKPPLKFGIFFFDYDLDGCLDLFVCNGHLEPEISRIQPQLYAQPPQLYWNTGDKDHVFEPVTYEASGPDLFKPMVGRGCAYLDYNGDGTLDVIMVENNGKARLLRNENALGNHYIRLTLVGDGKTANTSAIGAQVTVEAGGKVCQRKVQRALAAT